MFLEILVDVCAKWSVAGLMIPGSNKVMAHILLEWDIIVECLTMFIGMELGFAHIFNSLVEQIF